MRFLKTQNKANKYAIIKRTQNSYGNIGKSKQKKYTHSDTHTLSQTCKEHTCMMVGIPPYFYLFSKNEKKIKIGIFFPLVFGPITNRAAQNKLQTATVMPKRWKGERGRGGGSLYARVVFHVCMMAKILFMAVFRVWSTPPQPSPSPPPPFNSIVISHCSCNSSMHHQHHNIYQQSNCNCSFYFGFVLFQILPLLFSII